MGNILYRCSGGYFQESVAYFIYLLVILYLAYMNGIHKYGILANILVGLIVVGYIVIPELISREWFPNSQKMPEKTKEEIEENCKKRTKQLSYYFFSLKKFLIVMFIIGISFELVKTVTPTNNNFKFLDKIYNFLYKSWGGKILVILVIIFNRVDISILKKYDPEDTDIDDKYIRRIKETNMTLLWIGIIFILLFLQSYLFDITPMQGDLPVDALAPTGI